MICDFLIFMKQTSSSGNENTSAVSPMVGDGDGTGARAQVNGNSANRRCARGCSINFLINIFLFSLRKSMWNHGWSRVTQHSNGISTVTNHPLSLPVIYIFALIAPFM